MKFNFKKDSSTAYEPRTKNYFVQMQKCKSVKHQAMMSKTTV